MNIIKTQLRKSFGKNKKSTNYSVWQNFLVEHLNHVLFKLTKKSDQILFYSEYEDLINAIIPDEKICKSNNWNRTEDITKFKNLHTQYNVTIPLEYYLVITRPIYINCEAAGFDSIAQLDDEIFDQSLEWSNEVTRSELKNKFGINDFRNVFGYAVQKDSTKKLLSGI